MKAVVKQRMRVPEVQRPGVGEQRLQYVEALIDEAMDQITVQNIVNSCQHSQGFSSVPLTWRTCMWEHIIVCFCVMLLLTNIITFCCSEAS